MKEQIACAQQAQDFTVVDWFRVEGTGEWSTTIIPAYGAFPKIRCTFLGLPLMRIMTCREL